jgi:putative DNA primase/helicase
MKCHAGCSLNEIVAGLDLTVSDLFPPKASTNGDGARHMVEAYDYVDEDGKLLFQATRYEPNGFAQRCPGPQGGWEWNLRGVRRVIYRLPRVRQAIGRGETIHIVEGEKDVHALERLGLTATCNPMGAGKWRREYAEMLRGARRVVVLSDCDIPGRKHGLEVAEGVSACVNDVRVVELFPDESPEKHGRDVADWLAAARTDEELGQACRLLGETVEKTTQFVSSFRKTPDESNSSESSRLPFGRLDVVLEHVPPEPEWYFEGYMAPTVVTLLAGKPKAGKTTYSASLTHALTRGLPFLGRTTRRCGVLLLSEERPQTLDEKRRIFRLERNVHLLMLHQARGQDWPTIVAQAVEYCEENKLGVLIVDTFDKWAGLRGEAENSSGAVIEAVTPLLNAAGQGLSVILVTHQRKSDGDHGEAVRGSNALVGAVDVVMELERVPKSKRAAENVRVLRAVSRFSSTPEELYCELTDDGYVPCDLDSRCAEREREMLMQALASLGEADLAELAEETGLPKGTVSDRMRELYDSEDVLREGRGVRGDKHRYRHPDSIRRDENPYDETNRESWQPELEPVG